MSGFEAGAGWWEGALRLAVIVFELAAEAVASFDR